MKHSYSLKTFSVPLTEATNWGANMIMMLGTASVTCFLLQSSHYSIVLRLSSNLCLLLRLATCLTSVFTLYTLFPSMMT